MHEHTAGTHAAAMPAPHAVAANGIGRADTAAPVVAADERGDVAVEHWADLFAAVEARLRALGHGLQGASDQAARGVLECAEALDQLHGTLLHELARLR